MFHNNPNQISLYPTHSTQPLHQFLKSCWTMATTKTLQDRLLFLERRKRGERKPRRSDACKRRANRRQHCTIILGVVISKSLKCPDDRPPLHFDLPISQQVGIRNNPQKSSDPLLLHVQFLPPTFAMQFDRTSANSNPKPKPTQSSTSTSTSTKISSSIPQLAPALSFSLARQSSRMCDNNAHHYTPQCDPNSHSELEM